MNKLTKPQKDKIVQFRNITGASEKAAYDCLKTEQWVVEAAIDRFFVTGMSSSVQHPDMGAIEQLFAKYKDKYENSILVDGMIKFCEDLNVDPSDIVMLVISFHMNAAVMCEYSKEEFTSGMMRMGCDSMAKLQSKLPDLRGELSDKDRFRDVYNFAYMFSREKGQKCVQLETAVGMWKLLFQGIHAWPLVDDWCEFLQTEHNRAISRDTWTQLYDFAKSIKPDFSNFDESAAWPYLIDEFVEWKNARMG